MSGEVTTGHRLEVARGIAQGLVDLMAPAAERIEIAGSIRREKPTVKDIEIVVIPRWREQPRAGSQMALGGEAPVERVNCLYECMQGEIEDSEGYLQAIKPGVPGIEPWHLKPEGRYWRLYLPARGIKVDVFLTDAERWGAIYTVRTGPADFSQSLVQRWTSLTGGHLNDGLFRYPGGEVRPTPEEEDVFEAVCWPWTEPRARVQMAASR